MIDIAPEHLDMVKNILRRHISAREVWVFGYRATGTAKKYSVRLQNLVGKKAVADV